MRREHPLEDSLDYLLRRKSQLPLDMQCELVSALNEYVRALYVAEQATERFVQVKNEAAEQLGMIEAEAIRKRQEDG